MTTRPSTRFGSRADTFAEPLPPLRLTLVFVASFILLRKQGSRSGEGFSAMPTGLAENRDGAAISSGNRATIESAETGRGDHGALK